MLLHSIGWALVVCIGLAILSSISWTADVASIFGIPGAWIGVALFGEGHDWEHMAGVLFGELLFFTFVCFLVLLAFQSHRRRA